MIALRALFWQAITTLGAISAIVILSSAVGLAALALVRWAGRNDA